MSSRIILETLICPACSQDYREDPIEPVHLGFGQDGLAIICQDCTISHRPIDHSPPFYFIIGPEAKNETLSPIVSCSCSQPLDQIWKK